MRTLIQDSDQSGYWDSLADEYHDITHIRCDDFHYGPQIPGERALKLLPKFSPGMTALELGCGGGQNSVWLAKQGVRCTAFDISEAQLCHARQLAEKHGADIEFARASLNDFADVAGARQFDFVHSSHAMEFVEDPETVTRAMAACVAPGGTLMISTVHPLYNGEWIVSECETEDGEAMEAEGVFLTNYFAPPDDVRHDNDELAVSRAYPVSAWFRWLRRAGLEVVALEEPAAVNDAPYTSADWADHGGQLDAVPSTIIFVVRKAN